MTDQMIQPNPTAPTYTDDTDENNLVTICNCGQCPTSATETLRVLEDFAHWCSINRYDSEVAAGELHSLMEEVEDLIDRIHKTLHLNIEDDTNTTEE